MNLVAQRLSEALSAVCPIVSARITGPASGEYQADPAATGPQIAAANAALAAFDWSQAAHDLWSLRKTMATIGRANAVRLAADRSTTLAAYQDVAGLEFQLEANRHYTFQFDGAYTAAAGTTGLQLALNGPAFSFLAVGFEVATSASAWAAAVAAAYDVGANGTGSGGATPLPFHIYGNISTTESGLLIVRGRSEVAGSQVTIRRGSYGMLFGVA